MRRPTSWHAASSGSMESSCGESRVPLDDADETRQRFVHHPRCLLRFDLQSRDLFPVESIDRAYGTTNRELLVGGDTVP